MNAPQLLEAAAQAIDARGWTQGGSGGAGFHGPCCAIVALNESSKTVDEVPALDRARGALVAVLPDKFRRADLDEGSCVVAWNDDPKTTKAEVLKKLKEAAASLRGASKRKRR